MTRIDSANIMCDKCGVRINHHVMQFPSGWTKMAGDIHFCTDCTTKLELSSGQYGPGMKLI